MILSILKHWQYSQTVQAMQKLFKTFLSSEVRQILEQTKVAGMNAGRLRKIAVLGEASMKTEKSKTRRCVVESKRNRR